MNPNAIHILEKNQGRINWFWLSMNPSAIHILEENLDSVDWEELSGNPNAIHILEKNLDKVCWHELSRNPNAIHILEKNLDKINWDFLSTNPSIFQLDYDAMRENCKAMAEEIAKIVWHPSRISIWPEDALIDHEKEFNVDSIRTIKMSIRLRS